MKIAILRFTFGAIALATATSLTARAFGSEPCCAIEAKAEYCTDCHGEAGQGYMGWYPMPRIAGQQPEYFRNQLKSFQSRNRENDIAILMYKVHDLEPGMGKALALRFKSLRPE